MRKPPLVEAPRAEDAVLTRRSRNSVLVRGGAVLLVALIVIAVLWLRAEQGKVELSGPAWDCTGTRLVPDTFDDEFDEPRLAPELVPGMACWATWSLISHANVPVAVDTLDLPTGGPGAGAPFRITAARVDTAEVAITSRPPLDDLATHVPVGARLSAGDQVRVGVLVEFGEGCTSERTWVTIWPTVHTSALAVPRSTDHLDEEDDFGTVLTERGLSLVGTAASSCDVDPDSSS